MSLSDILWIVYVISFLIVFRLTVRAVRRNVDRPCSGWDDVAACMFVGVIAGATWLFWIVPVAAARLVRRRFRTPEDFLLFVGGQSRSERLKRQADRIAELERELNIR